MDTAISPWLLWIKFAFVYLNFVDEAAIMEQYGNEVGLAAFEWCDVLDPEYRRFTWIGGEEWFNDVTNLILEKWSSSASGNDESSVLPLS